MTVFGNDNNAELLLKRFDSYTVDVEKKIFIFDKVFADKYVIDTSMDSVTKKGSFYYCHMDEIEKILNPKICSTLFSGIYEEGTSFVRALRCDGSGKEESYNKLYVKQPNNKVVGIIIRVSELLEQKNDLELIKSFYEVTARSADVTPFVIDFTKKPIMFWGTDDTAKFIGVEPNVDMMYENSKWVDMVKKINGREVYEHIHDNLEAFKLGETDEYRIQYKMPREDGSLRWVQSVSTFKEVDENGNCERVYGVNIDIDETKMAEENLWNIFNHTAIGICILRKEDGLVIDVNDSFLKILASNDKNQFIGKLPGAYLDKYQIDGLSSWDMNRDHYRQLLQNDYVKFTQKYYKVNGDQFWGEMEVTSSKYNNEPVYICSFKNIDELKQKQKLIEDSERSLSFAMENAKISIWEVDAVNNVGFLNENFIKHYGGKFKQDNFWDFWTEKIHPQDRQKWIKRYVKNNPAVSINEYRVKDANDEYVWVYSTGKVTEYGGDNEVLRMSGIIMNINNRKLQELKFKELEEEIYHDSLTGLYNGRFLNKHIERLKSKKDLELVAFHANISNFRKINEAYGFKFGDKVLKAVADHLLGFRSNDNISQIFRVAGDEFLTLSTNRKVIDSVNSREYVTRTSDVSDFKVYVDGVKIDIRMAVGACTYPNQTNSLDDLIHFAEECMLRAKSRIDLKYVIYEKSIFDNVRYERNIVMDATISDITKEFEMYFQPIVDINDTTDYQFESLIRWNNPRLGILMPNDFISILEKSGHLKEIGFIMIEKVISQIAIWKKEYNKDVRVSFNISESSLRSFDFTDRVIELLDEHKVSPTNLSIELVEQLIDDKNEIISVNLQKFRDKGIIISIDDFGVAYSNLLRITDFDYDVLKIDKKFTNVVDRNDTSVILEMIRKLTDIKGCTCVAEGVETKAQLLKLKELGITKIQGFYFSVPLQVSDATKWLLKE